MASPSSQHETPRSLKTDSDIESTIQDLGLTAEQELELDEYVLSSRVITPRRSPASKKNKDAVAGTPKHKRRDSIIGGSSLPSPAKIHERSPAKNKEGENVEKGPKQIGWLGYDGRQWARGSGTPASASRMSFRDKQ